MKVLHTANYHGNVHEAATSINKQGYAEYVLSMSYSSMNTIVVFLMPAELVYKIRSESRSYANRPDHDFPTEKVTDGYTPVVIVEHIGSVFGRGMDATIMVSCRPVTAGSWRNLTKGDVLYLPPEAK